MAILHAIRHQGWLRTGALNIILASTCGLALLIFLAISYSRRDIREGLGSTKMFKGPCARASTLSTVYHIGLNIISTGILSSSNFFMQIVSSPSRKEIDYNHAWLRSLSIGLPSPANIPVLSRKKQLCWAILLISSVPIHLFFNSAIYSTTYQSATWNVTIATDHFVKNGVENQSYWLPGASLAISGTFSPAQQLRDPGRGYGERLNGYWDAEINGIRQEIAATARDCQNWDFLDKNACMEEFRPYKYRMKYKNVAIIVHPNSTDSRGWRRDEVFGFKAGSNLSNTWDSIVPPDKVNSLWFWTTCSVSKDSADSSRFWHSCSRLFSMNTSHPIYQTSDYVIEPLTFTVSGFNGGPTRRELDQGYLPQKGARNLDIDHCLAELPMTCEVRVSNSLMLITIVCVGIKITTSMILMATSSDGSLITPGDAIESFIAKPDPVTQGLGTLSLAEAQELECDPRREYHTISDPNLFFATRPRRWIVKTQRLHSLVTRALWVQVYYPIFLSLVALLIAVIMSGSLDGLQNFGHAQDYNVFSFFGLELDYLGILIVVNFPQLILSFAYLTVNALHTQLQVEHELNSYARTYIPLRVSYPAGEQVSTYRLQLPYSFSVPLIIVSISLHYLVSQSLFVIIAEGGAGSEGKNVTRPDLAQDMGVSPDAAILMSYSGMSMLIFFLLGLAFALSPVVLAFFVLKNDMVMGGTNSLVLSAACHVPSVASEPEGESDSSDQTPSARNIEEREYLREVARRKVRWGAMPLPPDLADKIKTNDDEPVLHLGFGAEEHNVQTPQTGTLYA